MVGEVAATTAAHTPDHFGVLTISYSAISSDQTSIKPQGRNPDSMGGGGAELLHVASTTCNLIHQQ